MATVTKGRTFVSGETVTPAKLNELVDNATVTAIQTADIADGQITNAKVSDSAAIAYSKLNLANSIVAGDIASDAVTTAKILNANVTPAKLSQPYTLATAQASTSGTSIDFTGIPSWAKRITVMFDEVSTNGTNSLLVQLGDAGGIETTSYVSVCNDYNQSNGTAGVNRTDGFVMLVYLASGLLTGHMTITRISGNTWVSSHTAKLLTSNMMTGAGSKTLSDTLTQVRVTTVGGTNTFDAGTINISYEG